MLFVIYVELTHFSCRTEAVNTEQKVDDIISVFVYLLCVFILYY